MKLSERIARLEAAAANGADIQADMAVIDRMLAGAEERLRAAAAQRGQVSPQLREAFRDH